MVLEGDSVPAGTTLVTPALNDLFRVTFESMLRLTLFCVTCNSYIAAVHVAAQ